MGLAGQKQVRHMYVGLTAPANANVAAVKAGASGNLSILSADGTAVAAGKPFKLYEKDALGNVISSDTIKPENVLDARSVAYTAKTLGVYTISGISFDANSLYTVELSIIGFGSLSNEDEYLKKGFFQAGSTGTAEDVVDGLIASLNRNFSREPGCTATSNPYFAFSKTGTGASAALVITEKSEWLAKQFDADKFINTELYFNVNAKFATAPTQSFTTLPKPGIGTGPQVQAMEFYLLGERADFYRRAGYPHDIKQIDLFSTFAGEYDIIEISYFDEGRDEAKKSKKTLTIALPTAAAPNADVNRVIGNLNTILGAGTIDTIKST